MRVLLQRVSSGRVTVEGEVVGSVGRGYVALVGITHSDTLQEVAFMARKVVNLRVFDDEQGKMNKALADVDGGVLVVSQFTLYANTTGGRRPDFIRSAPRPHAEPLVEAFVEELRRLGVAQVATGRFGAMMHVDIHNDGPVTIWLDSAELM